jgi:signal transduction histidine kinase/DNA-binding response OmpR family regulator
MTDPDEKSKMIVDDNMKNAALIAPNRSVTILVVEDSPTQAEALRYVLEEHNFRVFVAGNGEEALRMIRQNRPIVVVSDILMPKMDGYELCKQIKLDENLKQIPVILLTALSDAKDVVKGLEVGADNFITKPFDEKYLISQIQHLLENPLPKVSEKAQDATIFFAGQKYLITSDRLQILNLLLSTYGTAVQKNQELGRVQAKLIKLNEDLEERVQKRTEQVLSERLRLYNVLETLPTMIRLLTPDYHVAFANRAFRERFGESAGRHCYEYCFGNTGPCEFCESYRVLATGKPHHWEFTTQGGKAVIDAYDFPFIDADGSSMILEMDIDVTERKQAEAALQNINVVLEQRVAERTAELETANKELEAFSYSVSHDLRAPLRGIDGFSQVLLEDYAGKLDDTGKDYLKRIVSSCQLMARLIDDILTISRISRAKITKQTVNLSQLAVEVEQELKRLQPERRVEFKIAPGLEARGDKDLLKLVFDNLLGNAFKFTANCPEPAIEFGTTRIDGEQVYFMKDNGAGFNMAYVDKLFKPFQRLHSEEEFPGTGIGLASVQRIINRHGGRVWAEGQKDKGAVFYFTLG